MKKKILSILFFLLSSFVIASFSCAETISVKYDHVAPFEAKRVKTAEKGNGYKTWNKKEKMIPFCVLMIKDYSDSDPRFQTVLLSDWEGVVFSITDKKHGEGMGIIANNPFGTIIMLEWEKEGTCYQYQDTKMSIKQIKDTGAHYFSGTDLTSSPYAKVH